ncbi:MAG: YfhO family protein [Chloroflexia bacterium]
MIAPQEIQETPPAPPGDIDAPHESAGPVPRPSSPNPKSKIRVPSGRPKFAVPLLLFLLAFLFMLPGLPPFGVAAPMDQLLVFPPWQSHYPEAAPLVRGGDILLQQLPWHHWIQDEVKAGRFPLWASGPVGGAPLFGYYQTAALYPLHLLWIALPVGAGLGIIMALKLWLAGLGMWLFLRALGFHPAVTLIGALGFMFSAGMVVWLAWGNSGVELLLPWLCWAAYAWCIQRKPGALVALALLTAFAIFGGNPEIILIVAVTAGIWSLGLIIGSASGVRLRQIAGLAAGVAVGGLLGAIQLLPFIELLDQSHTRYMRAASGTLASLPLDVSLAINWALPRWWGGQSDGVMGGPHILTESNAYVGLAALLGLVLAVVGAVRRSLNLRLVLPWLVILILALLLAYDDTLGSAIRSLPLLNEMISWRWIQPAGFSLLVIGAFGWDWLARTANIGMHRDWRDWRLRLGVGLTVLGLGLALAHLAGLIPHSEPPGTDGFFRAPDDDYRLYWALWSLALLAGMLGLSLLWRWLPSWRFAAGAGIALLVVADLWRLLYGYNPTSPIERYYPTTSFIRQVSSLVPPTERLVGEGEVLPANVGLVFNIRDWRYQDAMTGERTFQAASMLGPGYERTVQTQYNMILPHIRPEVAPIFGIRYIVYPQQTNPGYWDPDPARPNFKRLAFTEGLGLWEIEGVPGFTYLSDNVEVVSGEPESARWIRNLTWEKVRAYPAVVEAPASSVAGISRSPDGTSPGSANVLIYTPGHITIQTEAQRPALLVVAESYYPGWHATLDGQPTQVLRTNYISQGVAVPVGTHTIDLRYEPDSLRNGALLSLVGLLGLAGLALWWRRGARQP